MPSAKLFPLKRTSRQPAMYDPKTKKFTLINTLFPARIISHFAADKNDTLWFSSGVGGRCDRLDQHASMFDKTGDEAKSQMLVALHRSTPTATASATSGCSPIRSVDPRRTSASPPASTGVAVSPADRFGVGDPCVAFPGGSCAMSAYDPPKRQTLRSLTIRAIVRGYGPRGSDIDRNGVFWVALASGHLGEFRPPEMQRPA